MSRLLRPLVLIFAVILLAGPALAALDRDRLVIRTGTGAEFPFTVEVARTMEEQARGLMFREHMPEGEGMLFPYARPQPLSFWMKNTLIPLDMIFIAADGRIINIETAQPHDLTPVLSKAPGTAVLEINGGLAERLGIRAGDRVLHPHFGTAGN